MPTNPSMDNTPVGLEEMLAAREERVWRQQRMRQAHGCPLISFSLNIAGPVKNSVLSRRSFEVGKAEILRQLERKDRMAADAVYSNAPTGIEALWAVGTDPLELKRAMVAIEEGHPLGRLFDIDVIDGSGRKISREQLNLPERRCLICGKEGMACARSRAHPLEELIRHTDSMMRGYFEGCFADRITRNAMRALLYEVCVTPKPGLVDRLNSGAHSDMDLFTFVDSACALIPYFREITLTAIACRGTAPESLLEQLRYPGLSAEDAMLAATGGVNTHKGLIYSLGIICASYGTLYEDPEGRGADRVLDLCARIASPALALDLHGLTENSAATHGEALYVRHNIAGVRGEAAAGFPSVRGWGLPALAACLEQGYSLNDAGVFVLLNLMAHVEDTNIISRSDPATQKNIQSRISGLMEQENFNVERLLEAAGELDREFIAKHISPGGCADLLAITLMLHFAGEDADGLPGKKI